MQEPLQVDQYSTAIFIWALFNLGRKGKPFSADYLARDFGADSAVGQKGVSILYDAICRSDNPKARVLFGEWKILFGEVCGYDVENPSAHVR